MNHHTKNKGDIGVALVIADLMKNGFQVCLPISEHLPFDLIAINCDDGRLKRVQVKYISLRAGKISIPLEGTSWTNNKGMYSVKKDLSYIDAFAIYCPSVDRVFYVNTIEFQGNTRAFTLRVCLPSNNQVKGVHLADAFCNPSRIFFNN
ncbi:group I intron-associated PD-(D/E)XK endonuclease [Armatimonas rosea]|uniref:group I intron-associated PD-(D/E)XK endonuclease n=1 Tax=Armatimonas rosea TaxID=685828 RepID=UPI0016217221